MRTTMIMFYYLFFCLISVSIYAADNNENYKFNRIDVGKGLSNSEVRCIFKDSSGFIWFGTPSGLNRYDGYDIVSLKQDINGSKSLTSNNDIWQIQEDAFNRLWIDTRMGYTVYDVEQDRYVHDPVSLFKQYSGVENFYGLYIDEGKDFWFMTQSDVRMFDVETNELTIFKLGEEGGLSKGHITDIKQGKNRYWFLFDNGLLECMDAESRTIISRDSSLCHEANIKNEREMRMFVDDSGDVWVYAFRFHFGAAYYNTAKNKWHRYASDLKSPYYISSNIVTSISNDNKGNIWIATDHGGVNILDKKTGTVQILTNKDNDKLSIAQNTIQCLYFDDSDIMWLGTYKRGVCYYHESIYKFKTVSSSQLPCEDINCFQETKDGNIWLGTNGGGLMYYDRKTGKYKSYKHDPNNTNSPAGDVIVNLEFDAKGRLWIGYFLEGMDCFDGKTFVHYKHTPEDKEGLTDNNIWVLKNDREGRLWIGSLRGGVIVFDVETGKRVKAFETKGSVYSLIETKSGDILVGSQGGLFIYNAVTDKFELYENEVFSKVHLGRNDINNLCEDSRGLLWIGTRNGLFVFNPYTKDVIQYTSKEGLSADLVQCILEDAENNMWISTNRGLTNIKVSTENKMPGYFFQLVNYDTSEGLQGEQFNYNAAYLTADSELIFGGSSGFNIFEPSSITYNNTVPKVKITDFQIYNKSIVPNEIYNGRVLLTKRISYTDEIELDYTENYFSITFAALDFCMPSKSRYYYKLEGFNEQWLEADRQSRRITYTNLNPGTYTFNLKTVNNDGIMSETPVTLKIVVNPPFWKTIWAWILYMLIIVGIIFWYRKRMALKAERKLAYAQEKLRMDQQLEMEEMKLRFFTNISHEFRTPLTLILTPLNQLMNKVTNENENNMLVVIERNARQLLSLVNQLLDFRKLDVNAHKVNKSRGDIVLFIREQAQMFKDVMNSKNINFSFETEETRIDMWFDTDKIGKVIMNLLSNALKFTLEGGRVSVILKRISGEQIMVSVSDNGIGLPEEALDKVFDRFYQVNNKDEVNNLGSGIGLHIAKEFIQLHGGSICAKQSENGGTCFEFILPVQSEGGTLQSEENTESINSIDDQETINEVSEEDTQAKLLIVEDNTDLRSFIANQLKDEYVIMQAVDGLQGLEIAFADIPDIVISDVMMPRLDGIKLCQRLKADIRTSHIPFILLTAKSGEESKLEGLSAGADDYITKPFNLDILKVKIHNIVEQRNRNRRTFNEQIKIEPSRIAISSLDEKLIKKALEYTEANMANAEFSVEELSRELGMSRVHLYKKLSSLTGKTPIEFIRIVRLKRAAQLLKESQMTVSEIAYEVGFNNPKYFRKYFKDEFGVLPSLYGNDNE
jgi:Signal transduction histidine kinase